MTDRPAPRSLFERMAAAQRAPTPCAGAVGHSDYATFDQRWCMAAGRWCRYAAARACAVATKAPQ